MHENSQKLKTAIDKHEKDLHRRINSILQRWLQNEFCKSRQLYVRQTTYLCTMNDHRDKHWILRFHFFKLCVLSQWQGDLDVWWRQHYKTVQNQRVPTEVYPNQVWEWTNIAGIIREDLVYTDYTDKTVKIVKKKIKRYRQYSDYKAGHLCVCSSYTGSLLVVIVIMESKQKLCVTLAPQRNKIFITTTHNKLYIHLVIAINTIWEQKPRHMCIRLWRSCRGGGQSSRKTTIYLHLISVNYQGII